MEKAEISKGLSDRRLAGSGTLDLNDAGTGAKGDTPLTQGCSLKVLRKQIDAMRAKHGANTPAGHRCSNLIEQMKHWDRANGGGEWPELLRALMRNSMADLARLSSGDTPHAEECGGING